MIKDTEVFDDQEETHVEDEEQFIEENDDSDSYDADSESENQETEDDDETEYIRAKWMLDGASNLDECIEKCHDFIEFLKDLKEKQWELVEPVEDDYGLISRKQ